MKLTNKKNKKIRLKVIFEENKNKKKSIIKLVQLIVFC